MVLLLAGTGAAHATTGPTDDQISDAEERVQELDDDLLESETRTEALDQRLEQLDRRLATAAQQLYRRGSELGWDRRDDSIVHEVLREG